MEFVLQDQLERFREVSQRRRGPAVYILDNESSVVMTSLGDPPFPLEAQLLVDSVRHEPSEASDHEARVFLSESGLTVRMQSIGGALGRYTAVFVEPFRLRDHLAAGRKKYALTQRECDVLQGVMAGRATADIGARLGMAASTVSGHIKSMMAKTETGSRSEMLGRLIGEHADRVG